MDAGYTLTISLFSSFGRVLLMYFAASLSPTMTYFSLSLEAYSNPDDLKGALKARVCMTILFPFIDEGEKNIRFWYCFATGPEETDVQSTFISDSGTSTTFVVSTETLALVINVSMPFTMSPCLDVSDMPLSFTTTREKKRMIAVPAIKTKIQLNCTSNPFLLNPEAILFPYRDFRMVACALY